LRLFEFVPLLGLVLLGACGRGEYKNAQYKKVIVIGVDGMDPVFVERHWAELPNLARLRDRGSYSHLATTDPPQSPVAWSTFITGLDPGEHGIFDFVHRDPATREPYLSTDKTSGPRFALPLGPYELPLSRSHVVSLRKGRAFWEYLSDRGIPVTVVRIPANYPPSEAGHELAGMGTPDLRGTQGTFSYFTAQGSHAEFRVEGPPNSLRRDHAAASVRLIADVDGHIEGPWVRLQVGDALAVLREGEWSEWLPADFPLLPHLVSARGMFRVFAKQLRPRIELYVSPVNVDPEKPVLPVSTPGSYAREVAAGMGRWSTLGIPEDTAALRQGVFDLPEFLSQTRLVLNDERRLLDDSLRRFTGGFLFFYFSAVDQNSHMLWGRHEAELLEVYRAVDASIGEVMRREPDAELMVMSDHGFASFDRAVNLNTWLVSRGFGAKAYALGLNGLYLTDKQRDRNARAELLRELRQELLSFRDPDNGRTVIARLDATRPSPDNRSIAPDLIVGYSAGYRASWQTALGDAPAGLITDNDDAWIADHCIDPAEVPAVLFAARRVVVNDAALKDLPVSLLALYSVARPAQMAGRNIF
jgi:predicted AlkP superfamily phosphohydrolase/phosphomutase